MGEPMTIKQLKSWLSEYINLKSENDDQFERIARMKNEEKFPAYKENDGSQHQPGASDRMGNAIIRRMSYEERVAPLIQANQNKMDAIEEAINNVRDPQERRVLRMRYIDGEFCRHPRWENIALKLYGDNDEKHLQAAYRLHGRALQSVLKGLTKEKELQSNET